jgi:hypothetical protein
VAIVVIAAGNPTARTVGLGLVGAAGSMLVLTPWRRRRRAARQRALFRAVFVCLGLAGCLALLGAPSALYGLIVGAAASSVLVGATPPSVEVGRRNYLLDREGGERVSVTAVSRGDDAGGRRG